MKKSFYLIIFLYLFSGCSSKEDFILFYNNNKAKTLYKDNFVNKIPIKNRKFEYKIMPHDRISLIVYKHPEFSTSTIGSRDKDEGLLVDGDGYVTLPVVDEVHIAGLTQKEARKKIEDAFSNYLKYSKVKLEVLNKRAYIVGEVKNPGEYKLQNEKTSLLKIIAKAGDMKDSANKKNILILRNQGNDTEVTRVDLTGKNSLYVASMMILPNDVVYVPPKGIKAYNSDVRDIEPTFRLISNMLTPFVNIKYLSN